MLGSSGKAAASLRRRLHPVCHEVCRAVIRFAFAPPRNPLARIALGIGGLALLALLSVFGLALAAIITLIVAGRALWLRLAAADAPRRTGHDRRVIDGEYSVVEPSRLPRER